MLDPIKILTNEQPAHSFDEGHSSKSTTSCTSTIPVSRTKKWPQRQGRTREANRERETKPPFQGSNQRVASLCYSPSLFWPCTGAGSGPICCNSSSRAATVSLSLRKLMRSCNQATRRSRWGGLQEDFHSMNVPDLIQQFKSAAFS
jgi:hypothetical protein